MKVANPLVVSVCQASTNSNLSTLAGYADSTMTVGESSNSEADSLDSYGQIICGCITGRQCSGEVPDPGAKCGSRDTRKTGMAHRRRGRHRHRSRRTTVSSLIIAVSESDATLNTIDTGM